MGCRGINLQVNYVAVGSTAFAVQTRTLNHVTANPGGAEFGASVVRVAPRLNPRMTSNQPWWLTWPVAEVAAAILLLFSNSAAIKEETAWLASSRGVQPLRIA